MILTITPNPCVDKTIFINHLEPGGRYRAQRYTCVPGGKGTNVSRAVKALGGETQAFVLVGGHTGRHVVEMITQDDGVTCVPFWCARPTRTITTVAESSSRRQTAFFEPGPTLSATERAGLITAAKAALPGASLVTMNGTAPSSGLVDLYAELIPAARALGIPVLLDTHGEEFRKGLWERPDFIKPNQQEAEEFIGRALDSDAARWEATRAFHDAGIRGVVLSLGAEGALISIDGERVRAYPPTITEVNPVGSGDALVAGLAMGIVGRWPLEQTVRTAIACGAANAMSWDIGHFSPADVTRLAAEVRIERV
jgi:tagatose 6-phosphate kinase